MYRVEQVLIPVDFSNFSRAALSFARLLAAPGEGMQRPRLQLAHAVSPMAPYLRRVLFPYAALGEDDREFEAEIAASAQDELARYFAIDEQLQKRFLGEPVVEFGSSKDLVAQWAGRFDADIIALGAFGESGVAAGDLGATARRVLQTSTRPVALLRDYEEKPRIRRILAGLDLGNQTSEVLRVALGLTIQQGAELELMHVVPSPLVYDTNRILERELKLSFDELVVKIRPRLDAHFERAVENLEIPFAYQEQAKRWTRKITVRQGDPAAELAEAAYEGGFDLVVVGANNRLNAASRSLGRVASQAVREVSTHLIVVPPRRENTPLVEAEE